jgi:3-deoxy-D-manno-octulosonic-acid transferase
MFIFLYHLAWSIALLFALPVAFITGNRRFFRRLAPELPAKRWRKGTIWVHALSVGEVLSAVSLVKELGKSYPERDILFTVTTAQGLQVARKELEGAVHAVIPMPLDFWWSVKRFVRFVKPDLFVLVETDLWLGLMDIVGRRGGRRVLVNGRISPRTFTRYNKYPFFARKMFAGVDLCLMQSSLDRDRLLRIGLRPEKILRVGNVKFDHFLNPMGPEERLRWLQLFQMTSGELIWVAGSTHNGEEEVILKVFKRLISSFPKLRLIIAPRRLEEAAEIGRIGREMGLRCAFKTGLTAQTTSYDFLVLDTLGELERVYGLADISFVGGSLVPVGGHNLLEPAGFGRPVLFGPHTHNFVEMSQLLLEGDGGLRVQGEEDLYRAIEDLLKNPEFRKRTGRSAERVLEENRGALQRVMVHLSHYL